MSSAIKKVLPHADPLWVEHGYGTRFQGFQNLMRLRIRDILLVSSLYDLYVFEEDGRLYELIREKYQGLNLSHAPELTRVSSGVEALALIKEERRFDMILTTLHIEDMRVSTFAKKIKEANISVPVVLLAFDNRELSDLLLHQDSSVFDQIFIWQGDFRLLLAIIKHLEDKMNVDHDSHLVGVQSIIVIEDNVRYYSSFLPIIYLETMRQSQRLISEGINLSHKQLRQRARPKILLCKTWEEAKDYFDKYKDTILGIISDIEFPHNGKVDSQAGLEFARYVLSVHSDIPVLLNSTNLENEKKAREIGASFLLKNSPTLLHDLQNFMMNNLSFGDFIFRTKEGVEVGRATDLLSLEEQLKTIPEESIQYHAERNHFSNWLKARTEFWLAHQLRPRSIADFPSIEDIRQDLMSSLQEYRKLRQQGIITDFKKESFDPYSSMSRIGGGSLGGKARGLSFVNILINNYNVQDQFEGVKIYIPPAIVIGTDIFDDFMKENDLHYFALYSADDNAIMQKFLRTDNFPDEILDELAAFLDLIHTPLAIRSSSLLEDSHNQPFAGVYHTYMLPNSNPNPQVRLNELVQTVKKVYASTFLQSAKNYIRATSYRLEEEKMAVIIQSMIGSPHNNRFYPDFAGVARSYNFYPVAPQKSTDGIVSAALGLGKTVVEGGMAARFCPKYPTRVDPFNAPKYLLKNSQMEFFALDLTAQAEYTNVRDDCFVKKYPLSVAEEDGTLFQLASTYSSENDAIYDGTSKNGMRLITLAPLLKFKTFPLPEILELLLDMGGWGMGTPVEIEFAVNLSVPKGKPKEFGILQMRPMVLNRELEVMNIDHFKPEQLVCKSSQVMGNGVMEDIYDIVMVDRDLFDRAQSRLVAQEVSRLNAKLISENRPYLLIGVGRWGSLDPWLGIPVRWDQIAGARVIIESDFKDFSVLPSQGSHFFQNLNSFMVGYFTVRSEMTNDFVDWDWLKNQQTIEVLQYTKHIRIDKPCIIKMNGHESSGIILKPEHNIDR
ncbi:MAG TPA: PEP/pyruvate-binding domain-containing protein [bacterium]|nr:PEP/pyruvate-binding domain-containing protein [bacterium]HPN45034.1 PEP/pyruvate-binding domain-containing protein [bacterium]